MRYLVSFILTIILFTGCAKTTVNQEVKVQTYYTIETAPVEHKEEKPNIFESIEKEDTSIFEIEAIEGDKELKTTIALIYPSKEIGKYALEAINAINTFAIYKNEDFTLEVFDIKTQEKENIDNVIEKIKKENINKVIGLFTTTFLDIYKETENLKGINLYLPILNKEDTSIPKNFEKENIYFGGISYKQQIEKLISYSKEQKFINFYDNSNLGETLSSYVKKELISYGKRVNDNNGAYHRFLKNNKRLVDATALLNTPIIKSSILLSQITANDVKLKQVLSTQLNYTPLLLSLTQKIDRKNVIIANSIGKYPSIYQEYSNLVDTNMYHNWVNYSTVIGLEYLLKSELKSFSDISIKENQVIYPIELYKVTGESFKKLKN